MENKIQEILKDINIVNIHSTLMVFYRCFEKFHNKMCDIPISEIDKMVENSGNQDIHNKWEQYKTRKEPVFIFYEMMEHHKYKTLRIGDYQRVNLKRTYLNKQKSEQSIKIIDKINKEIYQLSPFDGIAFLGKLIGAWMLTCPESVIRSVSKKETPSSYWLKVVYPDQLPKNVSANELELRFILDHRFYDTFEVISSYDID